jgi:tetratricopeptide (TPR) repeat protein
MLKRGKTHILEEESKREIKKSIPADWIIREHIPDYGIDWEIQIVESGVVTNKILWAQIKATERLKSQKKIHLRIESKYLKFFEQSPLPVVILYWIKETGSCYYTSVQEFIWDNLDIKIPNWKNQKTITLKFPKNSKLSSLNLERVAVDGYLRIIKKRIGFDTSNKGALYWVDGILTSDNFQIKELSIQAIQLIEKEKIEEGIDILKRILKTYTSSPIERISVLMIMGVAYYLLGNFNEALLNFNSVVDVSDRINAEEKRDGLKCAFSNIGLIYSLAGNVDQALEYLDKAIKSGYEDRTDEIDASIYNSMALAFMNKGLFIDAIHHFEHSLSLFEGLSAINHEATILNNMGLCYKDLNKLDKANECFHKALAKFIDVKSKLGEANVLGNIGIIHRLNGKLDTALSHFNNALKIHQHLGNKNFEANEIGSIGLVYMEKKQFSVALEYLKEALEIHETIGDKKGVAGSHNNIGFVYMQMKDYENAIKYYRKALDTHIEMGFKFEQLRTLNNLVEIYRLLGDFKSADEFHIEAKEISKEIC